MPRPPTAMRKIREVLRLTFGGGLSRRQVAAALHLPPTTVADHVARARKADLTWPLPEGLDDALEGRLFRQAPSPPAAARPLPDWAVIHRELRRKGVTLQLLHYEYKAAHPAGYQYSQFCRLHRAWQRHIDLPMRQEHRAGEKCFVDFPGDTLPIVDPETGVVRPAQLFVAVLGASNYTYAEAVASQSVPDWVAAHVHALECFGAARDTLEEGERGGVRGDPGPRVERQHRAHEHVAREAQHHHERPHPPGPPGPGIAPATEQAVVDLGLLARVGGGSGHRDPLARAGLPELRPAVAPEARDPHRQARLVAQALVDGRHGVRGQHRRDLLPVWLDQGPGQAARPGVAERREPAPHQAAHSVRSRAGPPGARPAASAAAAYLRTVLTSTPRLAATTAFGRPACQCWSSYTTSITSNALLAIGTSLVSRDARGRHVHRQGAPDRGIP